MDKDAEKIIRQIIFVSVISTWVLATIVDIFSADFAVSGWLNFICATIVGYFAKGTITNSFKIKEISKILSKEEK